MLEYGTVSTCACSLRELSREEPISEFLACLDSCLEEREFLVVDSTRQYMTSGSAAECTWFMPFICLLQ